MSDQSPAPSFDFRLHQFALGAVAIGVVVSLIAAAVHWFAEGAVATTMLKGTAFAACAAVPVWRSYRKRVQEAQQPTSVCSS